MLLQLLQLHLPHHLLNKTSLTASLAVVCLTSVFSGAAFSKSSTTDSQVHSSTHSYKHGNTQGTSHSATHKTSHNTSHSTTHATSHSLSLAPAHQSAHSRTHSGRHIVLQETQTVAVVTRDRRGHKHTIFKTVTAPVSVPVVAVHKVTKRIAVLVKDRHGRMHKVFRTETVEVADVHEHIAAAEKSTRNNSHSRLSRKPSVEESDDNAEVKLKKVSHDDGEPKPDGVEAERLNPSYGKAYALYDEGANARISGNYPLAISTLGRALATVPANSRGGPSVLQLNMEYDLAQAAEAQGDMALAARYYARALSDRPNFTEAAVRLATVLARSGNYGDAIRAARSAVTRSPNDPRTHALLSVLLAKSGSPEEAKAEKQRSKALMANIHSLDTAPLVSPDVVPPASPQESSDPSAASNKGYMSDDASNEAPGEADMPHTRGGKPSMRDAAPTPGSN